MEEHLKQLEEKLLEQAQRVENQSVQLEDQSKKIDGLMTVLLEMKNQMKDSSADTNRHQTTREGNSAKTFGYNPKLSFPKFDGTNSRVWIKKCSRYFSLCNVSDEHKVDLASLNMVDKAEKWVTSYLSMKRNVDWGEFCLDLSARFKDVRGSNTVEQFNKLQQTDTIEAYLDSFEDLKSDVLNVHHDLPEDFVLESFIGGLNATVKPFVKAFKPTTIAEAVEFARLQEEQTTALSQKLYTPRSTYSSQKAIQAIPLNTNKPTNSSLPALLPTPNTKPTSLTKYNPRYVKNSRHIPADVRADKIAKGLCYYCDAPYDRSHKCQFKEPQLFTVEISSSNEDKSSDTSEEEQDYLDDTGVTEPILSLNALSGNQNFQTMRVKGHRQSKVFHVLIDSGSTHNFLDLDLAKKMGCMIESIPSQAVTVADGNHLACQHVCKGFTWEMQGKVFTADVMLITLGGCDMVLGVQWLATLGSICWDFKALLMEFRLGDCQFVLRGIHPQKVKVVEGAPSAKLFSSAVQLCILQVREVDFVSVAPKASLQQQQDSSSLEKLKEQFKDIFADPDELPPHRGVFDHTIPLEPNARPVNIRPYRYPLKQRDVIEQLIQDMLERGVIQNSSSPFASPVVLVGKKDGTWRLCVDYRELNNKTIKNKFPIPVIDELIDELASATVFSKLDLRAGYHQLRVHDQDVYKTAFKTHSGHFEFLVMPFGLTNAPASFQSWMYSVFKPLLRKCVLVFFDDILVYSKTQAEHWRHLKQVFELMRLHKMFAKASKCSFAIDKVEYLGHLFLPREWKQIQVRLLQLRVGLCLKQSKN
ncbi:uncharacterized protein [Spinacia oleracea]|uniref:Reverse transcriptase domain-containing protein n=1 Tax=Spinacia oleracea TaxID=3562 RepID=A0A9R0JTS0_SPIOL|nr:uncharacterized protein LOC110786481 [Spinacia oleracea]